MWENTTPSTELPMTFVPGSAPLQLGVVIVLNLWPREIFIQLGLEMAEISTDKAKVI